MTGIVVGVDGSDHSERALAWALEEAQLRKVAVVAVTAVGGPTTLAWTMSAAVTLVSDEVLDAARTAVTDQVAAVSAKLEGSVPDVTVQAVQGAPAEVLLDAAADADLLVVGSRGAGGFSRMVLGSVSSAVVHHAKCPVVVVR